MLQPLLLFFGLRRLEWAERAPDLVCIGITQAIAQRIRKSKNDQGGCGRLGEFGGDIFANENQQTGFCVAFVCNNVSPKLPKTPRNSLIAVPSFGSVAFLNQSGKAIMENRELVR